MTNPFFRYSLEKQQKIRVMLLQNGVITQKNAVVLAMDETTVTLRLTAKTAPAVVPVADILSCDYARGDHGDDD